jgi:hypothetical protein
VQAVLESGELQPEITLSSGIEATKILSTPTNKILLMSLKNTQIQQWEHNFRGPKCTAKSAD